MTPPEFAHLPLILAADKSKLSKRHGATSVSDLKKYYLPEALLNFMGFIGYTYSKEILTKEEMAEEFELAKVHKSGAIFDTKKLDWLNSQYIKHLDIKTFKQLTGLHELPEKALSLVIERLEKLTDAGNFSYLWEEPKYDKILLKWKNFSLDECKKYLGETRKIIENFDFKNDKMELRRLLDDLAKTVGDRGLIYWPLRVALTGEQKSPDPVDIAYAIGKEKTLKRITNVT